jgi:dienelactone hydrolase
VNLAVIQTSRHSKHMEQEYKARKESSMLNKQFSLMVVGALISCAMLGASSASALNFTGRQGNKATFETLEETRASSPIAVGALEGNKGRTFKSHPVLDNYPQGTTFVYRSANLYGGRAAARMNTNLVVYVEQHFDSKDAAMAWLKSAGLIDVADEATGTILLVTPRGKVFGSADVSAYYALQTAMFAQNAMLAPGSAGGGVFYSDPEYFGGFGYLYFIGIDGGASFFNNYIATTTDFAGRIAGALLVNGRIDEIRRVSTFLPVYLVNNGDDVVEKYKRANHVNATRGSGGTITYYNQAQPLQRVVVATANTVDSPALVKSAYHDMFIKAMRIPVLLQGMNSAGTPYSGYNFDEAPYSLCQRNAIINGVTSDGIHLISHQGETRFAGIKSAKGEFLDTWYEYIPEEVLNGTAAKGSIPLILGNHGGGDDPRQFVDEMGLLALAGNERIAVVAADHQSLPNDVRGPALTSLVKYMLKIYPALDPSRVYAIGYSMGGGATYTVGYYEPGLFAAVAPIAGTNIEPTSTEAARFTHTQLPIYLSTSSYDVRRLQAVTSRINDNLANQVKRWSAFNGVAPVTLDFNTYKLSGFKGDSWTVETLNNEYTSYTWYLNNDNGYPMVALNYVKDLIHALYPEYAYSAWDYMKHFSRDQKSGQIKFNPY